MSLIYFPQLVAGLLPALLPALAGGPAAGWARPPGEAVTQASLPLLGSRKSWGLSVTGWAEVIIKLFGGGVGPRPTGRWKRKGWKVLLLQAFAGLSSFRQVIPTLGPQFSHLFNGSEQSYAVPRVPGAWTLMLWPASFQTPPGALPTPCHGDHGLINHHLGPPPTQSASIPPGSLVLGPKGWGPFFFQP